MIDFDAFLEIRRRTGVRKRWLRGETKVNEIIVLDTASPSFENAVRQRSQFTFTHA